MLKSIVAPTGLILLALSVGCASRPAEVAEPTVIPLATYVAKLRQVDVQIDGEAKPFLFDTGGGYTLVSPEISEAVGCEPSGILTGFRMSGERLDAPKCGEIRLGLAGETMLVEAGLFDLNALLPDSLPPLFGVLSMHTFADGILTVDLANNRLILETPESATARVEDMLPIDAAFYTELEGRGMDVYLKARTAAGKRVHLLLDSGNLAGNLVRSETWRELSEHEPPAEGENAPLRLVFGDAGTRELPVTVRTEMIREGLLDAKFVESAVFTFDFPARRAWVRWNEQP